MKKVSVEERLIRSMGQAVEIAEGTTAPSCEYDLPRWRNRAVGPHGGKRGPGCERRRGR